MRLLSKLIARDEEIYPSPVISVVKELQKRIHELEHEVWNMRFALNEFTHGKAQYYLDTSLSKDNIDNKLHLAPARKQELVDDHLKEAREFIRTMVEHDRNDIIKQVQNRTESLLQFLPNVDQLQPSIASAQRFMRSLDSENLLRIFNSRNMPAKKTNLDNFVLNVGQNLRIRRHSAPAQHAGLQIKLDKKAAKGMELKLCKAKISSLKQLSSFIQRMSNEAYEKKIMPKKTEIARWTRVMLGYKEFSRSIALSKSKQELLNLLRRVS